MLVWARVTCYLPQSQCVEEVHVPGEVPEPRDGDEAPVGGPRDRVAVGGAELVQRLTLGEGDEGGERRGRELVVLIA